MSGEHRPLIADLLWEHSKKIIGTYAQSGAVASTEGIEEKKDT